jgi:hypothetical protein
MYPFCLSSYEERGRKRAGELWAQSYAGRNWTKLSTRAEQTARKANGKSRAAMDMLWCEFPWQQPLGLVRERPWGSRTARQNDRTCRLQIRLTSTRLTWHLRSCLGKHSIWLHDTVAYHNLAVPLFARDEEK